MSKIWRAVQHSSYSQQYCIVHLKIVKSISYCVITKIKIIRKTKCLKKKKAHVTIFTIYILCCWVNCLCFRIICLLSFFFFLTRFKYCVNCINGAHTGGLEDDQQWLWIQRSSVWWPQLHFPHNSSAVRLSAPSVGWWQTHRLI